jgi:NOL1/NOP2/sun family putative RNA methylase
MTKRSDPDAKRAKKAALLIERTALLLACSHKEAANLLSHELKQSVRLNPLVAVPEVTLKMMHHLGWKGTPIDWSPNCYTINEGFDQLRDSELIGSGAIYIQNQASWLPVMALDPQPRERILDVCAAPGGKTSHIAALISNDGELMANDNSRPRLLKLQANLERLNVKADYTLYDATRLSHVLEQESFDKILLDAPCSGEGLINLTDLKRLDTWSVAHIRRLSVLQKRLLSQSWQLLKPGGKLVYSTCTLAPEENEAVIDWFLRRNSDAAVRPVAVAITHPKEGITSWNNQTYSSEVKKAIRLLPEGGREAFFTCVLERLPQEDVA